MLLSSARSQIRYVGMREGADRSDRFFRVASGLCGEVGDLAVLDDLVAGLAPGAICGLADGAAESVGGVLRRFRSEVEAHVRDRACPFSGSFEL